MTRSRALGRVALFFLAAQLASWVILQLSCSESMRGELWCYGALGPLAAVEAVPRFRYHSLLGNAGFVAVCLAMLAAPFAYAVRPGRFTLALSAAACVVWVFFGLAFSIDHV
jgi:hypothetical protein